MNFDKLKHNVSKDIKGKPFHVFWSSSAEKALQKRGKPLVVEMELKFACMVRLLVHFYDDVANDNVIKITDQISVFYNPVIGQSCDISEAKEGNKIQTLTEGPMAKRFPKKLGIDYNNGQWVGKFS